MATYDSATYGTATYDSSSGGTNMPTTLANFAALADIDLSQHRKSLSAIVFIAPYAPGTTPHITDIVDSTGLVPAIIPTGYYRLGAMDPTGIDFGDTRTSIATTAYGASEPGRTDWTGSTKTIAAVFESTNLTSLALMHGVPFSSVTVDPTKGQTRIDDTRIPQNLYFQVLALGVDTNTVSGLPIIFGKYLPKATITVVAGQKWLNDANGIQYGLTFTGTYDATAGTARRSWVAGPGWLAQNTVTISSLAVTPNPLVLTSTTTTGQLVVTATNSDGSITVVTSAATYVSSNTAVATVGASTGLVTRVAIGTATVTATDSGVSGAATVNVTS